MRGRGGPGGNRRGSTRGPAGAATLAALVAAAAQGALSPAAAAQPRPPDEVQATAVSADRIDVSWSEAPGNVLQYRIYRDGAFAGSTSAGTRSFSDTGLQPFTEYGYTVTTVDFLFRESDPSDPAVARTLDETPPSKPENLVGEPVDASSIDLRWDAATDPESGIAGYRVYRDDALVASPAGTTYRDTGLEADTRYRYRVSAVNGQGLEGPRSGRVSVRTLEQSPPPAPVDLTAEALGPDAVRLTWRAGGDDEGIEEYRIYRNGARVGTTAGTEFTDTGLAPATTWEYVVTAVGGGGEGPPSESVQVRTPDGTPPSAPPDLQTTAVTPSAVTLSWSAAADPETGVAAYRVYRDGGLIGESAELGFEDFGLQPETDYLYAVTAVNGDGLEGEPSELAVTTASADDGTPPPAPDGIVAVAPDPTTVELSWNAVDDPESGVAGYVVYRDGERLEATIDTRYADTGLDPGTRYAYTVSAVNGDGLEGPRSAEAIITTPVEEDRTPPAPPTGLRVLAP